MNIETVRGYFKDSRTVAHYVKAVANIGLWESEKRIFENWLDRDDRILDLGCGAGRIAFGLRDIGFGQVEGADFSEEMVVEAREIAEHFGASIPFCREDATCLSYGEEAFGAVVFGFNGLMQIPGRTARRAALSEVFRILKPGGCFVFTTLDRDDRLYRVVFKDGANYDHDVERNPNLIEEGDRHFSTEHGTTFMHVPRRADVAEDLEAAGWLLLDDKMRSEIARERTEVSEFSEDCRFWIARKPTR